MKNVRANPLGAILNNNNEWCKAGRSTVGDTGPLSVASWFFYRSLFARWLVVSLSLAHSLQVDCVSVPPLSAAEPTISLSVTHPSLCLSLSSNSVGVDGGKGVIELLKGDDSVTVVIESSHKRALFMVAKETL